MYQHIGFRTANSQSIEDLHSCLCICCSSKACSCETISLLVWFPLTPGRRPAEPKHLDYLWEDDSSLTPRSAGTNPTLLPKYCKQTQTLCYSCPPESVIRWKPYAITQELFTQSRVNKSIFLKWMYNRWAMTELWHDMVAQWLKLWDCGSNPCSMCVEFAIYKISSRSPPQSKNILRLRKDSKLPIGVNGVCSLWWVDAPSSVILCLVPIASSIGSRPPQYFIGQAGIENGCKI